MLGDNNPQNVKLKDLSPKQLVGLILLAVYSLSVVAVLVLLADKYPGFPERQILCAIIMLPFFAFTALDLYLCFFRTDKKLLATSIIKQNAFLFNYDYQVQEPVITKNSIEVLFQNENLLDISFICSLNTKQRFYTAYFVYNDCYIYAYKLLSIYQEAGEFPQDQLPELNELFEFILSRMEQDRAEFFKLMDLLVVRL